MTKNSHIWVQIITLVLLVGAISYQTYTNYELKKEIENINIDLTTHQTILNNINLDLNNLEKQTKSQFDIIDEKLQISSSQISNIKEDLANVEIQTQAFTNIIDDVLPAVVAIIADNSQGSGVIISEDGYIVTNYHVIEDARRIRVLAYDDSIYNADLLGFAKNEDIALLKIDKDSLDYLTFGDSDDIQIGERVIALGNPAGLAFSVTEGIVSAIERVGPNGLNAYIQIDVPINPGNSGGPLVNIKKDIIGINNFKIGGFESLGFAIDSNHVQDVVDEILEELAKLEQGDQ